MLPLAVDIDERVGDLTQYRQADGPAIDPANVPAVGPHLTRQKDKIAAFFIQPLGFQERVNHLAQRRVEIKGGFDVGALASGPNCGAVRPPTQHQHHGIKDDRFARAGLAGEDVEARAKAQLQLIDDGKIADGKLVQHVFNFSIEEGERREQR